MRRLVGLLVVGAFVATGVVVAVGSKGASPAPAPAQTPKLSPVAPFFSLTPSRPQKAKQAPSVVIPDNGYSCPATSASGSPCSHAPCHVFVAPGPAGAVQIVPGSRSCRGSSSPRAVPIATR